MRAQYTKRMAEIDAKYPPAARANVKDMVNHIDYAVKLIGIDHGRLSVKFQGLDARLSGVEGAKPIQAILA